MNDVFWTEDRLATVRGMVKKGATAQEVADHFGTTRKAVLGASNRHGISGWARSSSVKGASIPDDFVEKHATMKHRELAEHYGVSTSTIVNWQGIKGVRRPADHRSAQRVRRVMVKPPASKRYFSSVDRVLIDDSVAGIAATYLRSVGYSNVYRRAPREWQVGRNTMTELDMIARADEVRARKERLGL